jgi:hypothetical protein
MMIPDQHLAFMPGNWVQIADEKHLSVVLKDCGEGPATLESLRPRIGERFRVIGYRRAASGRVLYQLSGMEDEVCEECLLASTSRAEYEAATARSRRLRVALAAGLCVVAVSVLGATRILHARSEAARVECANTLRFLAGCKEQWANEKGASSNAVPTWDDLWPYVKGSGWPPQCPSGGQYTLGPVCVLPSCSIPEHTASAFYLNQQW